MMMIDDDENENEIVCSSFFLVFVRALSFRVCVRPLPSPSCGRVKTKKKKLSSSEEYLNFWETKKKRERGKKAN